MGLTLISGLSGGHGLWSGTAGLSGGSGLGGGGSSFDPAAAAYFAAVVAAGGTISPARQILYNNLFVSLRSAGVLALLDRLWLLAAENSQSALIDLVARATATAVNSPTFATNGYTVNGITNYIDTGYMPSVNAVMLSQNSAHLSFYCNSGPAYVGGGDGSSFLQILGTFTDSNMYARINTGNSGAGFATTDTGIFIGDRTGPAAIVNEHSGVVLGTTTPASLALGTKSLWIGAYNNNGSFAGASAPARLGMFSAGASLGASGRAALENAVGTYMTAVGA